MQPLVVGQILASALLHALWNAALKRQRDPELAGVALLAVSTLFAVAAVPFGRGPAFPGTAGLLWAAAAGVCEGGYFVTLARGLRIAPLGVVYTIARGGALIVVWPVSLIWLGERVSWLSVSGALAVLAGLALVGLAPRSRAGSSGALWAAICALFVAGYHLCYKCALAAGAGPTAVFAAALGVALPISVARVRRQWRGVLAAVRERPIAVSLGGAICTASFLIFLAALAEGGAGAVVTLRNTSVVFALILAWLIGERPGPRQIAGMIGVALGAVALGWP